jgi:NAD(P)-dependent dehydrogenase (short-subunit alcohol dehydrogenase family)/acyl dehydratase
VGARTAEQLAVVFSEADLDAFALASGDRNPLHLSVDHARQTAYGERVVFGCLGAIAALARLERPPRSRVRTIEATFLRPLFLGVSYRVETDDDGVTGRARLYDGSVLTTSVTVELAPADPDETTARAWAVDGGRFERVTAAARPVGDLALGDSVEGTYACDARALAAVMTRWGLDDPIVAASLGAASYVVGMELPGESALLAEIRLTFDRAGRRTDEVRYRSSITSIDERFMKAESELLLGVGGTALVTGRCSWYARSPVPAPAPPPVTGWAPSHLRGKVVALVGASRGLGAALSDALQARGAIVFGLSRSARPQDGRAFVGDAADPVALRRLRAEIVATHGRLDVLVCNAAPPVLPLRLEPSGFDRIAAYVNDAVALTLRPLTEFLDLLHASKGVAVIVSSTAVDHPVPAWPHYLAAKGAVEALGQVAALQYANVAVLIVRPPKLLTSFTNTPMGRLDAAPPEPLADAIARWLESPSDGGTVTVMR